MEKPHRVYGLIFLTSLVYAPLLTTWQRRDPVGFNNNTWLTVVIGCGYTLLYSRLLMPFNAWLRICTAFFVACIPIIGRSLLQNIERGRELDQFYNGGRRDE